MCLKHSGTSFVNVEELKEAYTQLPPINLEPKPYTWEMHRLSFRHHVEKSNLAELLNWSTITATMFVSNDERYIQEELKALQKDDWGRWRRAIKERAFGNPKRMKEYPYTSGSLIHQAYHLLQWEQVTGKLVSQLDRIIEFGGGYGALCALIRNLGFKGEYIIYDIKEVSLIQEFYLSNIGISATYISTDNKYGLKVLPANLMIALYSISEVPDKIKNKFLLQQIHDTYLILHQQIHDGKDLWPFFNNFAKKFPELRWVFRKGALTKHRYMIGMQQ